VSDWFVSVTGQTSGPHPADYVVHWVRTGQIPPDAGLWMDGGPGWLQLPAAWPLLTGVPGAGPPIGTSEHRQPPVAHPGPTGAWPGAAGTPAAGAAGYRPGAVPTVDAALLGQLGQPSQPLALLPRPPAHVGGSGRNPMHAVTDRLADFAGVDRVEGFPVKDLLSAAFRRYSREEIEQHFATGLPGFTPELGRIQSSWPKPWMFVRLLAVSGALFLGFLLLIQMFQNTKLLPGLLVIGSFAVPAAVMIFFFEVNTPRNVSLYFLIHCMMVGGLISLGLTLMFVQSAGTLGDLIGPPLAGFVEELGKLLAVVLVTARLPGPRYPWILNGMLFGAAVGAGFAAFESAGYAFTYLVTDAGFNLDAAIQTIVIRGLLAPFGHVVWTALAAGALWRVKLDQPLRPRMLVHRRVLRMFLVVMLLHAAWDVTILNPPFMLKYVVLGFLAWVLAIGMLQTGLKQIKAAQMSLAAGRPELSGATMVLRQTPAIGGDR
jgi:RsiW-degrading membrane proteinase PrsW (M82 family)